VDLTVERDHGALASTSLTTGVVSMKETAIGIGISAAMAVTVVTFIGCQSTAHRNQERRANCECFSYEYNWFQGNCGWIMGDRSGTHPNCLTKGASVAITGHRWFYYGLTSSGNDTSDEASASATDTSEEAPAASYHEWDIFFVGGRLFDFASMPADMRTRILDIASREGDISGSNTLPAELDVYEIDNPYPD
jgi:hypothetical protein